MKPIEKKAGDTSADVAWVQQERARRNAMMERPPRWSSYGPRHRVEHVVVVVDVEVLAYKTEPDDDIHAIIRGGRGHVMVAEFPAPWCTSGSPYAKQMELARRRFLAAMQRHVQHLRFTGVIFFDKVHGQIGGTRYMVRSEQR